MGRAVLKRVWLGAVLLAGSLACVSASAAAGLEGRVQMLAKALDLDASQKTELRQILQNQREQVERIWSGSSLPPAYRIAATQAASEKTGDAIRAILNDEQKQKYNQAKPPPDQLTGSARPDVAEWMGAMRHDANRSNSP